MKKYNKISIILLIFFLFSIPILKAQRRCGTSEYEQMLLSRNPNLQSIKQTRQQELWNYLQSGDFNNQRSVGSVITIPVVVHLIGSSIINFSLTKVQDQINILNQDYGKMAGTNGDGDGVDTKIQFCLAITDPFGFPTNGVISKSGVYPSPWNIDAPDADNNSNKSLKFISHWPGDSYLNIYVVDAITDANGRDILGYATVPDELSTFPELDGVVISKDYFGITADPDYNSGRTCTHEVGHWLGLYHTFRNGCLNADCSQDGDECCDTPPVDAPNFDCNLNANSCHNDNPDLADQIENYMDYTPDLCMNMFTQNQADRMFATLHNERYYALLTSCIPHCANAIQDGDETGFNCGGIDCPPCSHCNNDIKDADETGVNCGGADCPPCGGYGLCTAGGFANSVFEPNPESATVQFTINGKATTDVINVCSNDINIAPYKYNSSYGSNSKWLFLVKMSNKLCSQTSNMWQAASKVYEGWFDNKCSCSWLQLFISTQECDENKNLIGPEISQWFYIFDSDQSVAGELTSFKSFNLNSYLPGGVQLQGGKYYKIKVASYSNGDNSQPWCEHNGYVRVYTDNLLIQNKTITHDQFANSITIENSTVPTTIDVVAKAKILILPTTTLNAGSYYIDNFDCTQLDQFHSIKADPSLNLNSKTSTANYDNKYYSSNYTNRNSSKSTLIEQRTDISENIAILPNPNNGYFQVIVKKNNTPIQAKEIKVYDVMGKCVWSNNTSNTIYEIDISAYPQGIYYVRIINILNEIEIKKLIKQ